MGFGATPFKVRQKIGRWGEETFASYFANHRELGIRVLKYGEARSGPKKQTGDAVSRPDLLLLEAGDYEHLDARNPGLLSQDLRLLPDADPGVRKVVGVALVAVEVKFSHREYRKKRVQFIIDERRKAGYAEWLGRTSGIGAVMIWFTTNRVFMAPFDDVLGGKEETRTYEKRGLSDRPKKTWNLPVESTEDFANVAGYTLNQTFKAKLQISKTSGAIYADADDDLGDLADVNLDGLRRLAQKVRRP